MSRENSNTQSNSLTSNQMLMLAASPVTASIGLFFNTVAHITNGKTIGTHSDDFTQLISKLDNIKINSLGGVATADEINALKAKSLGLESIDSNNPNDPKYAESTNAVINQLFLESLANKVKSYDYFLKYGIDKEILDDPELKKDRRLRQILENESISAKISSTSNELEGKNNELLSINQSKLFLRLLSMAITFGAVDAVSWAVSFFDCFAGVDFETGIGNALRSEKVMGPFSEINKAFGIDKLGEAFSKFPILNDVNNAGLTVVDSTGPVPNIIKNSIDDNPLLDIFVKGAVAVMQLTSEYKLNKDFQDFRKEAEEKIDLSSTIIHQDIQSHYEKMAELITLEKMVYSPIKIKLFEEFSDILLGTDQAKKSAILNKFDDFEIKNPNDGEPKKLSEFFAQASNSKDINEIIVILAKEPQNLIKFFKILDTELKDKKSDFYKNLLESFLANKSEEDIKKIDSLSEYASQIKSDNSSNVLDAKNILGKIDQDPDKISNQNFYQEITEKVALDLFKSQILHDIKTKESNSHFKPIELSELDSRSQETLATSRDFATSREATNPEISSPRNSVVSASAVNQAPSTTLAAPVSARGPSSSRVLG